MNTNSTYKRNTPVFWFIICLFLIISIMTGGCASKTETQSLSPTNIPASSTSTPKPFRVALLATGTANDKSWANAWYLGVDRAKALGAEITFVGSLDNPDQYVTQGSAFASQGYDFIMMAYGAMVESAIQVAKQFPDTLVCVATFTPPDDAWLKDQPNNACFVDVEQQDATFLAGMLAGLVTKTNHVASVNAFVFPGLTRQAEGFALGARCSNADIKFSQEYINTWEDAALAKASAQVFIGDGADVILSATDQAVLGLYSAAKAADHQVWIVSQYVDTHSDAPEVVLTSALQGLDEAFIELVRRAINGELSAKGPASFIDFTVENDPGIKLAPLYDDVSKRLSPEVITRFNELVEMVKAGKITIPDEQLGKNPIGTVDSAAKIDLTEIGCPGK